MIYGPISTYLAISLNGSVIHPTTNLTGNLNPQVAMGFALFAFGLMCAFKGVGILSNKSIIFRGREIKIK